jgi:hypothetical protein
MPPDLDNKINLTCRKYPGKSAVWNTLTALAEITDLVGGGAAKEKDAGVGDAEDAVGELAN